MFNDHIINNYIIYNVAPGVNLAMRMNNTFSRYVERYLEMTTKCSDPNNSMHKVINDCIGGISTYLWADMIATNKANMEDKRIIDIKSADVAFIDTSVNDVQWGFHERDLKLHMEYLVRTIYQINPEVSIIILGKSQSISPLIVSFNNIIIRSL